jgi:hypothetical protein
VAGLKGWQASARLGATKAAGNAAAAPPIPLKLREVAPSATAATRTYRARYAIGALPAGSDWRMGMTAELLLRQPGREAGTALPASALLVTGAAAGGSPPSSAAPPATAGPAVWVVDAGTGALQRTPVQMLSQSTDQVRVTGLPDGALVVSVGAQKLDAGLTVRPVQRPLALDGSATGGAGAAR